jgi:[NiFe] hydrogenase assembly HybE family chaperone
MTEAPRPGTARPSPATALVRAFEQVLREQMQGLPMLNPALAVEAVGFREWREHWLGILVTPWFMNLVLMPRIDAAWHAAGERESRAHVFPAGVFDFIGGYYAELGDYQACSLFSPMFDFANQDGARATAAAALEALFDSAHRATNADPVPLQARASAAQAAASVVDAPADGRAPGPVLKSKRSFLLGGLAPSPAGAAATTASGSREATR